MGSYGNLPVTGMGALVIGGVAVARPIVAAVIAAIMIAIGVALRLTNRHPLTHLAQRGRSAGSIYLSETVRQNRAGRGR